MFKRIRIRLIGIKTILETGIRLKIQEGITLEMILGTEIIIQMWTNLQKMKIQMDNLTKNNGRNNYDGSWRIVITSLKII